LSQEPPKDKSKPTAPPKCRHCQGADIQVIGRMEQSKETVYRCTHCGFVFTTT